MGEKYIPRIGDVIIYDDDYYVVMDMKVYESYQPGERYYSRYYSLLKEKTLNEYLDMWNDGFFPGKAPSYKKIAFRGFESELPDIKKVDEASYGIEPIHGFCVIKRGKRRKVGIIER